MSTTSSRDSAMQTLTGVLAATTGGGVVTFALFPFVLPIVILTVVAALPLLVLALAMSILIAPVLLVRRMWRRRGGGSTTEAAAPDAAAARTQAVGPSLRPLANR